VGAQATPAIRHDSETASRVAGGSVQIDLSGAKLTASGQTAAGAHQADTDRKAVTAARYGT
jgi:hypothetical protein